MGYERETSVTLRFKPFRPIQCTCVVASISVCLVGIDAFYVCASLSHKCQREFSELKMATGRVELMLLDSTTHMTPLSYRFCD